MLIYSFKTSDDVFVDIFHALFAIDFDVEIGILIVVDERFRLCSVDAQAFLDGFDFVVIALIQFTAAFIADVLHLGRFECDMVCRTAGAADLTARRPFDEFFIGDGDVDDAIEFDA